MYIFPWCNSPQCARTPSLSRLQFHIRLGTPQLVGLLWTSDQLVTETSTSQHTNIHAPGEIQTHNYSKRAAAGSRFRPRGHGDRRTVQDMGR
jgi:hypothetical protein